MKNVFKISCLLPKSLNSSNVILSTKNSIQQSHDIEVCMQGTSPLKVLSHSKNGGCTQVKMLKQPACRNFQIPMGLVSFWYIYFHCISFMYMYTTAPMSKLLIKKKWQVQIHLNAESCSTRLWDGMDGYKIHTGWIVFFIFKQVVAKPCQSSCMTTPFHWKEGPMSHDHPRGSN